MSVLWFYCRYLDRSWQHRQGPVPPAPSRPRRFGLFKVALTISLGLAIGAFIREGRRSRDQQAAVLPKCAQLIGFYS
jgi:hypothetical protein